MSARICARCGQEKYSAHEAEEPHASNGTGTPCDGYLAEHPCQNPADTGAGVHSDLELHDPAAPHARPQVSCPAAEPQDFGDFEGGGGSGGGGGASGEW